MLEKGSLPFTHDFMNVAFKLHEIRVQYLSESQVALDPGTGMAPTRR